MSGYVRLYRSLIGHAAFHNDAEVMAFAWLILQASWKTTQTRYKGQPIVLQRGQVAITIRDMAASMNRKKNWVERLLARLKAGAMIRTETGQGVTIITICKYDEFQSGPDLSRTANRTTAGQRPDTEQERQESKKVESEEETRAIVCVNIPAIQTVFECWNRMAATCAARSAAALTAARKAAIQQRIDEYSVSVVLDTIELVPWKPWLMGDNDREWIADLDFFLRPDSITKIKEGKYDRGIQKRLGVNARAAISAFGHPDDDRA